MEKFRYFHLSVKEKYFPEKGWEAPTYSLKIKDKLMIQANLDVMLC
jgi:hypothetical protein